MVGENRPCLKAEWMPEMRRGGKRDDDWLWLSAPPYKILHPPLDPIKAVFTSSTVSTISLFSDLSMRLICNEYQMHIEWGTQWRRPRQWMPLASLPAAYTRDYSKSKHVYRVAQNEATLFNCSHFKNASTVWMLMAHIIGSLRSDDIFQLYIYQ